MESEEILKVACIQMTSGPVIEENLKFAAGYIREAANEGAQLIATPENTCWMRFPPEEKVKHTPYQEDHPGVQFFPDLARELRVWILVGSMAVKGRDGKLHNRSFLFSDTGKLVAFYDKIHLFDAVLSSGEVYAESNNVMAGDTAVVAQTPWGGLGMTICYDLRFSHLYRDLAKAGASILAVPAAFTVPTGQAHWETLLRARAIETGCFVIAPAQTGEHDGGRRTWGHSLIISPWGKVLARTGEEQGYILADLDLSEVEKARQKIPALTHDRSYKIQA